MYVFYSKYMYERIDHGRLTRRFDKQITNRQQEILVREKPGWGSREEKERNEITEEQANDWCIGNMTGSETVGVCWEAAVTAHCKRPWTTSNFIVGY